MEKMVFLNPPPPRSAPQSPLHEILIKEVEASLPRELCHRLREAATLTEVNDWIAAGALFRWVARDPYLSRIFLEGILVNPRDAGMILARAIASRMEPPERNARWRRLDCIGILFQSAFALLTLFARVALMSVLSFHKVAPCLQVGILGIWMALETTLAPGILEYLRQTPALRLGLPPPLSWRSDTFHVFWFLQELLFLFFLMWKSLAEVCPDALSPFAPWPERALSMFFLWVFLESAWLAIKSFRSSIVLGTIPFQKKW